MAISINFSKISTVNFLGKKN